MTRTRILPIVAVAALALIASTGCTRNLEAFESYQLLNGERIAHGLPTLALDDQLVTKAHEWAATMAASGWVRHSKLSDGAGTSWTVLGENVGATSSVADMHRLFMASPVHRSSILDPRMTRVGTGVAIAGDRVYVVQVFSG